MAAFAGSQAPVFDFFVQARVLGWHYRLGDQGRFLVR
jgi:hypothetical protein